MEQSDIRYAGFWIRVVATLIDSILILAVTAPVLTAIYGVEYWEPSNTLAAGWADILLSYVLPAVAVIIFWMARQATPGKMAIGARIVDARTGEPPSTAQCVGRYLAYFPAMIPLLLGVIWVAFDPRKQGWHDKLAGTVVVKSTPAAPVAPAPPQSTQ